MSRPNIMWFRKDLRLSDNPALHAAIRSAIRSGDPVIYVFILDDLTQGALPVGGAAAWWLYHSLTALRADIELRGAKLLLLKGDAQELLMQLAKKTRAKSVYWNRCYEPEAITRDTFLKSSFKDQGIAVESFNGSLLREPWELKTKAQQPFRVFTPFWKALCAAGELGQPLEKPEALPSCHMDLESDLLEEWKLCPAWSKTFTSCWTPGEAGARDRLNQFLETACSTYPDMRNRPDQPGTSKLAPHLAFGEISPRQVWHYSLGRLDFIADRPSREAGVWSFLREIGWRDFNHNLLFHNRTMPQANFNQTFDAFEWGEDAASLLAWQRGQTGYPLVDAGMRELWATGFMHNRVRMVTASFLIKHLMIHWRQGEAWFRDTLLDADLSNNVANWQWTAGCGADAAPYFRIFNPITQGEKFDCSGRYTRQWVPELSQMPDKYLHKPWAAPESERIRAGVRLGETYPFPIVDHSSARNRALNAYATLKGAA